MKLIDAFKQFLLEQKNPASPATVKNYLADIRKFVLWFEERFSKQFAPQEVTLKTVDEFRASISQGEGSAKSIERYVSSLRKFFRFLKLEGIIATDPFETQQEPQNDDPLHLKSFKNFLYVYNASTLTIKNYLIDIRQFFTWAQTVFEESASPEPLLSLISPAVIEEYKQRLLEENVYSPTSINRKLSSLRKYFAWAIEQGIVTRNPFEVAQSHNNPLNLEAALATDISGRILEKQPEQIQIPQRVYSAIPPVRLVQKSLSALDFLMEKIIVTPVTQALNSARLFVWHAQGKPVFTRPSLGIALKPGQKTVRTTTNFPKEFYAPLKVSITDFPWYKKAIFHLRFTRPNWYRKYHSYAISHYFNLAVLFIFCVIIGTAMYSAFVNGGQKSPSLAAGPASPLRILSFQGRLTDNLDNPITTARNLRFTIYSDSSASGSARLWEEVDNVGPDQDGIFSVLLGSNGSGGNASLCNGGNPPTSPPTGPCGIPQSLFAQNAQLWLGVTVENGSELTPRQQLATVAYASNAETLQGLPPTTDSAWAAAGTNGNAVLALSSNGVVNIAGSANAVTVLQAASSQVKLTGNITTLATNPGSNGNVQIIPDGSGWIDAQKPIFNSTLNSNLRAASNNASTSAGAVEVDDLFAVLATSSGQSAVTIDQDGVGPIISASHSGSPVFTVGAFGDTSIAGNTNISGNLILNNSISGNVSSNIIPTQNLQYDLGSSSLMWRNIYAENIFAPVTGGTSGFWQLNNGALAPANLTNDLLVGSTATASATFGFINVGQGTPTATISAGQAIGAIYLTAKGKLATTNAQSLSIGDSGTGNITLSPMGGTGVVTINGSVAVSTFNQPGGVIYQSGANGQLSVNTAGSIGQCLISNGSSAPFWAACSSGSNGVNYWTILNGALSTANNTADLLVGGNSTASAKFAVLGVNTNSTVASVSAQNANNSAVYVDAGNNTIQTVRNQNLTIGGATTGNIFLSPLGGTGTGLVTITGNLALSTFTNQGGVVYQSGTNGQLAVNTAGSVNQCLVSGGTGAPTWATCATGAAGVNWWTLQNGALNTINNSADLLIGGTSTPSAHFAVLNVNTNSTIASVSAQNVNNSALYLDAGNNALQTVRNQTLTLGGTTTGNISLNPLGGNGTVTVNGTLNAPTIQSTTIFFPVTGGTDGFWQLANNVISPSNTINDLVLGGTGTSSAKFHVFGATGNVAIGSTTTSPLAALDARVISNTTPVASLSGNTSASSLVIDQTGSGNIFTAQQAGGNRFTIANNGTLTSSKYITAGGVLFTDASGNFQQTLQGNNTQCLMGGAIPSWSTCALGTNWWTVTNGTLFPINQTLDFLIGGNSTASAHFGILGVNNNATIASISAQNANNSAVFVDAGNNAIQTVRNQNLTIGGNSTGNITLSPLNGGTGSMLTINANTIALGGTNTVISNTGTNTLTLNSGSTGNIQFFNNNNTLSSTGNLTLAGTITLPNSNTLTGVANFTNASQGIGFGATTGAPTYYITSGGVANLSNVFLPVTGGVGGFWQLGNNVIAPSNLANDFAVGGNSTASAKFQVFSNGNATTAGTLTFNTAGSIQTTNSQNLTVGGATTGDITLNPLNSIAGGFVAPATNTVTDLGQVGLNFRNVFATTYNSGANVGQTLANTSCINTVGGIVVSTGSCGTQNWWTMQNGLLYPINSTLDLAIGGTATTGAIFAVSGSTSTGPTSYPTASVSATTGNFTGDGIILAGNGSIQSLRNNNLTIGGTSTGNITLSPLNGGTGSTLTVNALSTLLNGTLAVNQSGAAATKTNIDSSGNVLPGTNLGGANLGSTSLYWTNLYTGAVNTNAVFLPVTGGTDGFWQLGNNVIAPSNLANDLAVGGSSTASAKFQVLANSIAGQPAGTATTSGNLSFRGTPGSQTAFKVNALNGSNLGFYTSAGGDTGLTANPSVFLAQGGNVGIGTTNAQSLLTLATAGVLQIGQTTDSTYSTLDSNSLTFHRTNNSYIAQSNGGTLRMGIGGISSNNSGLTINSVNSVGINTTTLENVALAVNQASLAGAGDIFTASTAGVTKFTIANDGTLTDAAYAHLGVLQSSATGVISSTAVNLADNVNEVTGILPLANGGTNNNLTPSNGGIVYSDASKLQILPGTPTFGQCLISGINSAPSWATCASGGAGINYWTNANGAIFPINSSFDLLVGGSSTASAKFAVLNMSSTNTPVASVSAQDGSGKALVLAGNGSIQSVNMQNLTFGGSSTGNIVLSPTNGSGSVVLNAGGSQLIVTGNTLTTNNLTYNLLNTSAQTINFAGAATALTMGAASGTTTINNNVLVKGTQLDSNQGIFNLFASPFLLNIGSSSTTASVGGNFVIGASASNTVTVNALLNQSLIPTAGGTINLGSSANPYNVVYANAFSTPVGNGVQGFWTVTNNTNLYPTNSADDLLVGGTGTGSASFQIFASSFNNGTTVPAGTATTSGNLTFFGSSTNHKINALNGGSFTFQTSTAGQGDTGLTSVFTIANNGDLTMTAGNISTSANSLNLFNTPTTINLGLAATVFNIGSGTGYTQVNNEFRANTNYRLNGYLLTNILPNTGTNLSLGSGTNPFNSIFVNSVSVPVNSFDGYWKMQNNVLSPQYAASDLAIGGTATGSATPFQVFANAFTTDAGTVPAGTASTSGNLTFTGTPGNQTTFGINLLNDANLAFYNSVGGDIGTSGFLPFYIGHNGRIGIETSNPVAPLQIAVDSSSTPGLYIGGGGNVTNYLSVSGGRGMFGYDTSTGNVDIVGGASKSLGFYVNGTSNHFPTGTEAMLINKTAKVGIGTTQQGNDSLVVNQTDSAGLGDIFSASASGATKFTIAYDGTLKNNLIPNVTDQYNLGSDPNAGGMEWNNLYVRQIITPSTGGIAGYWQLNSGVLSPSNIQNDLEIGGSATGSAVFQVFANAYQNDFGTVPAGTATMSGNLTFTGSPSAQTSFRENILNGASLGFYPSAGGDMGTNLTRPALYIANNGQISIGTASASTQLEIYSDTITPERLTRYITANTAILDLNAPDIATGHFSDLNWRSLDSNNTSQQFARIDTYFMNKTAGQHSGDLAFDTTVAGIMAEKMRITGSGSVGIGTSSPLAASGLDIEKDAQGNAAFMVKQQSTAPNVDIITASSSAGTKMRLDVNGNMYASKFIDIDNPSSTYFLDPANTGSALIVAGNAGIGNISPNARLELAMNIQTAATDGNNADLISADDTMGVSTYTPIWRVTAQGANEQLGGIDTPFGGLGLNENRLVYSEQFSNPAWQSYCQLPTTIQDNTTDIQAPDGTYTANKSVTHVTLGCSGNEDGYLQYTSPTITIGKPYTASIWMRGATGTERVAFGVNDSNFSSAFTLTQTWKRYTYTTDALATVNTRGFQVLMKSASATYYIWGAQLEQRNYAGTYVATTTTPVIPSPAGYNSSLVVNATGSAIFGGSVAIGTTSADRPLTIEGTGNSGEWISLKATTGDTKWHLNNKSGGLNFAETGVADGVLFLQPGGNVGIGTTTPSYKLEVNGNVGVDAGSSANYLNVTGSTICFTTGGTCAASTGTPSLIEDWGINIVGNGSTQPVRVDNASLLVGYGNYGTNYGSGNLYVSGNVGIGTTGPSYKLDVIGDVRANGGWLRTNGAQGMYNDTYGGGIYMKDTSWIRTYPDNTSIGFWANNGTIGTNGKLSIGLSGGTYGAVGVNSCAGNANNFEHNGCNAFDFQSSDGKVDLYGGTDPGFGGNYRSYIQSVRTQATATVDRLSINARGGNVDLDAGAGNFDYAEIYHSNQIIKPGELVQISHDATYNGPVDNGGIVINASNSAYFAHPENNIGKVIERTTSAYSPSMIGVASSHPSIVINDYTVTINKGLPVDPSGSHEPPIDLAGRAPVNVSTINGPIHYGDPITSSNIPGFGMKSTKAGFIVGRAMQEFDPTNGSTGDVGIIPCPAGTPSNVICGQVYVYATTTWYDPDIFITDTGTYNITQTAATPSADFTVPHYFDITDAASQTVTRMGAYVELVVGNLRTGALQAQQTITNSLAVATDQVSIAGQSLHDYIASVVKEVVGNSTPTSPSVQSGTVATNVISPLSPDSSISATLTNNQLAIHADASSTSAVVAAIDNSGNATFSGTVNSNQLAVNGDATISGTLFADKIEANSIVGLQAALSTLSAQNITNVTNIIFATGGATGPTGTSENSVQSPSSSNSGVLGFAGQPSLGYVNLASYSGFLAYVPKLEAATAQFDQGIISFGPTSLADTSINGQLSIGANMILADNTLNVLGQDLEIQPLRQGGVDFLAGAVKIDSNGDLTVNGKAVFNKGLYASIISPLAGGDLTVQLGDSTNPTGNFVVKNASGSGVFAVSQVGDIIASGAATISKLNLNPVADAMAVSQTEVIATSSAGTAVVNAYQKEITIDTPFVTAKSLIYITPIADTTGSSSQTPFLLRQTPGQSFTVGVNVPTSTDTKFNWLIIN